jgi:hypothetical protein
MKTLFCAALLAFAVPALAHAQGTPAKPKPKDNVVLVQTPDSAATALKRLARALVSKGYTVDKLDGEFFTLLTAPKAMPQQYNPVFVVRAIASPGINSTIKLTGEYSVNYGATHFTTKTEYAGSETGNNKTAFRELQQAAAVAYPQGQVSYTKE